MLLLYASAAYSLLFPFLVAIMDIIDPILSIAEKLSAVCDEVKANKKRCRRLVQRVSALVELVNAVKHNGLGKNPELVQRGLRELKVTLESAEQVLKKYASSSCLKRIVKAFDLGEEFGSLNERLNDAAQLLSLALQVEQRKRMEEVFKEDKRTKEDEDDRRYDCDELQNCMYLRSSIQIISILIAGPVNHMLRIFSHSQLTWCNVL